MRKKLYYRNLRDAYQFIQLGGWKGTWEDFLQLNVGQVMRYACIAQIVLSQIGKGDFQ